MKRWFDTLPVHSKLVVMALTVTTAALFAATAGLVLLDLWRYQRTAAEDATSLARVLAGNVAAAVAFDDAPAASETLATVRVRPAVIRACVYGADGALFVGFGRTPSASCEARQPSPRGWRVVASAAPILAGNDVVGSVYVERDLAGLGARVALTAAAATAMFLMAGALAYVLAHRLQRTISRPIAQLATAARGVERDRPYAMPPINVTADEIGELVGAFGGMVARVRAAKESLIESNETLRLEVEERRRIEAERELILAREREASRLKDEFLAAVSHELRTPLHAILGWVQILATTDPSPETTERALATITRNAHMQSRVIADLVDVSRIVTGKLNLQPEAVDLRSVVKGAADDMESPAEARTVRMNLQLPDHACIVTGDSDRLQQVVWNLLSNGVKFTPTGGTVEVTLTPSGGIYTIDVADTGVGIAPEFLPHVFDRFRQADGSMKRSHGGLGLGLAIVKELTELHGGTVVASSRGPGEGATFTLRFPAAAAASSDAHEARAVADTAASVTARPSLNGVTILAVDDNPDAVEVLQATLGSAGGQVRVATSGSDAIRAWDDTAAQVLVCDLAMPEVDGFDVLREIRKRDALTGHVTLAIALTAHASDEHRARTLAAGFDHHIAKPFTSDHLLQVVVTALERA